MRNPNGYGGVVKLSGKRRKPFMLRLTDGWDILPDGKKRQRYIPLGYYESQKEAKKALAAYNESPSEYKETTITFSEVYTLWIAQKEKENLDRSTMNAYKASFDLCKTIKDMKMTEIKTAHLQGVIDDSKKNHPMLRKFKSFLSGVYGYAMANDYASRNYSEFVNIGKPSERKIVHVPFTIDEINTLWANVDKYEFADTILIQIYTGMRIGELLAMQTEDVHTEEKYMIGGLKTEAGKRRTIPLHRRIIPLVEKRFSKNNFLITTDKLPVAYDLYLAKRWTEVMEGLNMTHLPHDCRHTFATLADTYGMNKLCRKRIMGHAVSDVTDNVYTHKILEELITEVNKLP